MIERVGLIEAAADTCNIADQLRAMATRFPDKHAVVWPIAREAGYGHITFDGLNSEADRYAHGLDAAGVTRGTRTVVFVKPGVEFFALTFALFRIGAVPVMIDPGIGKQQMRLCLSRVNAEAFIAVPLAHVFRKLSPSSFRDLRVSITVGRRWLWGGLQLADVRADHDRPYESTPTRADETAAILFTSGSTGPAKGVVYTHGVFDAQVRYLRTHFGFSDEEKDLPTFPLFALFDAALGMTAVIPDMDFTKPASVDPRKIIAPIRDHSLTQMFGSPALLDSLSRYGVAHGIRLPTIKRVITAGAPVSPAVLERMHAMLPDDALIHTPYGATESLPVASIDSREILTDTQTRTASGGGTCVGRPMAGIDVRVIPIDDQPIGNWSDELPLPPGKIGEIVVRGPVVTRTYHNDAPATAAAKISDSATLWHRMGDVGYFDERSRLWFCGRKAHRVVTANETLYTVRCEAIFNQHPDVHRSALVGLGTRGTQKAVICIELEETSRECDRKTLTAALLKLAAGNTLAYSINTILYHPGFPVDVRHNAKIFREKLAVWAAGKVR